MTEHQYPSPDIYEFEQRFWEAASQGRLMIQECQACEHTVFPPRVVCPNCFSQLEWIESRGRGKVHAKGMVHRPNLPEVFEDQLPLTLVVVELREGPRMVSQMTCNDSTVQIGDKVQVSFERITEEYWLPKFECNK